jgi:superoxide dismutase, Cu-Zn family
VIKRSALAAAAAGTCLVALSVTLAGPAAAGTNRQVHMAANLSAADSGSTAVSYDPELAPLGARISVAVIGGDEGLTKVAIDVSGLLADRGYVAQAHGNPCGATAADAGPAETGVRLDLQTDGDGGAHAETDVPSGAATGPPRSVVVHDGTAEGPGVACITLPGRR